MGREGLTQSGGRDGERNCGGRGAEDGEVGEHYKVITKCLEPEVSLRWMTFYFIEPGNGKW